MKNLMRKIIILNHNNLDNWYDNGCKGNKPTLQKHLNKFPTFYKDNMYVSDSINSDTVQLKLFINIFNFFSYLTHSFMYTLMTNTNFISNISHS